ncbi:MAG TPA: EamA family transporter [Candidatus Sulfotelmatobacter sp.]|jgi:inner membrane transporter RhtA|nr:EamA family transporter [Candidatus Sulfotelmatobacter sp.]
MPTSSSAGSLSARLLALLCLILAMISVQVGAAYATHLFGRIGPEGTTGLRCGFSALVLVLFWRPWRGGLSGKAALAALLYGLSLGCMNMCFYLSLEHLPLGVAVAVEFSGPLVLALISSRRPMDFLWIALALAGLAGLSPLSAASRHLSTTGLLLALAAGACWAAYIIFGKRVVRTMPGNRASALGMLVAALLSAPFAVVHAGTDLLAPSVLTAAFVVSLLSSTIPYSLEMVSLKRLSAKTFSIVVSLEPAVAAASGWAVNGEHLSPLQMTCMAALTVASLGCTASSRS